ncbi:MAG: tRNA pseudouridine(38-40) synthase TruA [Oscillospiraceae bacterium]|nr:tRNA pseudouridine(38-40) synthase TruA [Oscillospiraceae bacterium]
MRYIALQMRYIGTAYHGWQRQKTDITIQQVLEEALTAVMGETITTVGCGRTDAGVHAETYVANFRTTCAIPTDRIPLALNTRLPDDIAVLRAFDVDEDFHAVFSCVKKEYTYRISNTRIRDPFLVNRVWFCPAELDVDAMKAAAARFVGTHDFAAVRSVGTNVKTTVRTVYYFDVAKKGDIIELKVCANGFLYNMVRAMSGTAVYAGLGKIKPEEIDEILAGGDRCLAGPTLPPDGLYMTKLVYDGCMRSFFDE